MQYLRNKESGTLFITLRNSRELGRACRLQFASGERVLIEAGDGSLNVWQLRLGGLLRGRLIWSGRSDDIDFFFVGIDPLPEGLNADEGTDWLTMRVFEQVSDCRSIQELRDRLDRRKWAELQMQKLQSTRPT